MEGQDFIAQFLTRLQARIGTKILDNTSEPFEGLPINAAIHAKPLSLGAFTANFESSEPQRIVNVAIKFLKRPAGYEGPSQLNYEIDLSKTTVAAVKDWIAAQTQLPASTQRLVYKGKSLSDEKLVSDYYDAASVSGGWTVHCQVTAAPVTSGVDASSSTATSPTTAAEPQQESPLKQLTPEFWNGVRAHLAKYLDSDHTDRVLKRFKDSLTSAERASDLTV